MATSLHEIEQYFRRLLDIYTDQLKSLLNNLVDNLQTVTASAQDITQLTRRVEALERNNRQQQIRYENLLSRYEVLEVENLGLKQSRDILEECCDGLLKRSKAALSEVANSQVGMDEAKSQHSGSPNLQPSQQRPLVPVDPIEEQDEKVHIKSETYPDLPMA